MSERLLIATTALALLVLAGAAEAPAYAAEDPNDRVRSPTAKSLQVVQADAQAVGRIAWHIIGRKMIESDARFNGGDYYDHPEPLRRGRNWPR